jgi:hypothetical protein
MKTNLNHRQFNFNGSFFWVSDADRSRARGSPRQTSVNGVVGV